jgi:hypothetical protein
VALQPVVRFVAAVAALHLERDCRCRKSGHTACCCVGKEPTRQGTFDCGCCERTVTIPDADGTLRFPWLDRAAEPPPSWARYFDPPEGLTRLTGIGL